jgi:HemY protein
MRRFISILFLFIFSIYVGLKIIQDPGLAFFTYQNWSVEMPLWLAVLVFFIICYAIYMLANFFDSLGFSFYKMKNWLHWRREHKAFSKTNRGLLQLIEGDWQLAENLLLQGVPQTEAPLINYLAAAKAAHELGNYTRRDSYLQKAHDISPENDVVIGLAQAQLQLNQGQLEQALASLGHLRELAPKHPFVLKLLHRLYIHLGDNRALLKLLPILRKAKVIEAEQDYQLQLNSYIQLLTAAESKNEGVKGYAGLQLFWDNVPKALRNEPRLVYAYIKRLMVYPEAQAEIESLLQKTLNKNWDNELIKLYGLRFTEHPTVQLTKAEAWLKQRVNNAALLLTLGRLSVRCQLWGKARSYYENSLRLESNPETYLAYGQLLEQLGEYDSARENYRNGLINKNMQGENNK